MSHDHLFDRKYDEDNYNCVHFVHEAGMDLYGKERIESLKPFMCSVKDRKFLPSKIKLLNPIPLPVDGCIVAFHPIDKRDSPHVGLYRQGRVLHLRETGVAWMTINAIKIQGFNRVSYYD